MLSGLSPFFHNLYLSAVFRVWSFDAESHDRSVFIPLPFRKILSVGITRFREICPAFPHRFRKSVILFRIRSPGTVQSTELVAVVAGMRYSRIVSRLFPVKDIDKGTRITFRKSQDLGIGIAATTDSAEFKSNIWWVTSYQTSDTRDLILSMKISYMRCIISSGAILWIPTILERTDNGTIFQRGEKSRFCCHVLLKNKFKHQKAFK